MDYLTVILNGYFNENNREHLPEFLYREALKAEAKHYMPDEFFNGLKKVLQRWKNEFYNQHSEYVNDRINTIEAAKSGKIEYANLDKPIEAKHQETVKRCQQEKGDASLDNFFIQLHKLTGGKIAYTMQYNELLSIEDAINKAAEKVEQGAPEERGNEFIRAGQFLEDAQYMIKRLNQFIVPKQKPTPPQDKTPVKRSGIFSVPEWATIFYYADESKMLPQPESNQVKEKMKMFISKHQVDATFSSFKAKYYDIRKRINEKNDYPTSKLKKIIPFLRENYPPVVTKVENEINFLEEEKREY